MLLNQPTKQNKAGESPAPNTKRASNSFEMKGAVRETLAPNYANMQATEPSALIGCGIARCKVDSREGSLWRAIANRHRRQALLGGRSGIQRFAQETLYTCIELSDYLLFLSNRERCCGVAENGGAVCVGREWPGTTTGDTVVQTADSAK